MTQPTSISQMMIFAAGRGTRLRPLTDTTPKPLVKVHGKPLIEYHLEQAVALGIQYVVINVSHLGQQIIDHLGDGQRWGLQIQYSIEETPLETAGGLVKARSLLKNGEFLLVNADIYHQLSLVEFCRQPRKALHLLMVPNPEEQPAGNFILTDEGNVTLLDKDTPGRPRTYGGLGVCHTSFIDFISSLDQLGSGDPEHERTPYYMKKWMLEGKVSGSVFEGRWCDVGTLERLDALNREKC